MSEVLELIYESLTQLIQSILRIGYLPTIDEVEVGEPRHDDGLVLVTLRSGGRHIHHYNAYLVEGMSFDEYLNSPREVGKAAVNARGCFAFPQHKIEDNIRASLLSLYAERVSRTTESQVKSKHAADQKKKFGQLSRTGGAARSIIVHEYYEKIRPTFNSILRDEPELSNHRIATRLNQLGRLTMNDKVWRDTTVQAMREYFLANPSPSKREHER